MAAATNPVKEQVTRIVKKMSEEWRAFEEKQNLMLKELDELLEGGIGIGEKMQHVEREFAAAWAETHNGQKYLFNFAVDRAQIKRLLANGLAHTEIASRAWAYCRDKDDFLVKQRHPFLVFVKQINKYAATTIEQAPPTDCKHDPKCKTEVECTNRRLQA